MTEKSRRERRLALMTIVLALAIGFALGEIALRIFFEPYRVSTIGHRYADNAALYGWGYYPGERFALRDPDTGEVYPSRVNSRGWRDKERSHENPGGAFRILVLGDSNTFGPTVPQDKIYPRILEDKLLAQDLNAEVISIAYGAWGTDQKLEALKNDGLSYRPDLVLLQYTANDVKFNVNNRDDSFRSGKPFYYRLDEDGVLVREENVEFRNDAWRSSAGLKRLKMSLMRSEVMARFYGFYSWLKLSYLPERNKYFVSRNQIERTRVVFGLDDSHPLVQYLEEREDERLNPREFARIIRESGLEQAQERILRIFENRWFNRRWDRSLYDVKPPDPESEEWRLFLALLKRIQELTERSGARLALYADIDETSFDWAVYWGMTRDTQSNRLNYLAPRELVEGFARTNGIAIIPNRRPYIRSRNDPHQNVQGNQAMAEDIYEYLMMRHGRDLAAHTGSRNPA